MIKHSNKSYAMREGGIIRPEHAKTEQTRKYAEGGSVKKDFYSRGEVDESDAEYDKPKIDPEIGIRDMSSAGGGIMRKIFDKVPSPISSAITGKLLPTGREVDDAKRAKVRYDKKMSKTDRASGS